MTELNNCFTIMLTDTRTNEKKEFVPQDEFVKLYVCGITPYDYSHIGHGRCYVTFDMLYRLLQFLGYDVIYARNFTDIDDKLLARAQAELGDASRFKEIATKFIAEYEKDMEKLNCLSPIYEPLVTDNIPEIIKFIEGLIAQNKAYVVDSSNAESENKGAYYKDVYYSIESFPSYGALSKRNTEDLLAGARKEVREEKRNPLDFALWKSAASGTPGWESPWGLGRPGWHIECSTLSKKYLGETIDIHGGGMDLIFPHHENERAQSIGLSNKPFVHYWLHNAFVNINKEKMSKSLGNYIILQKLFEQFDPMVLRYYFLIHHYRSPIEFSPEDVQASAKSYQKLAKFFNRTKSNKTAEDNSGSENSENSEFEICCDEVPLVDELIRALCDDLNVAKFFGIIFENFKELESDEKQADLIKIIIQQVLGLKLEILPEKELEITPEIQDLIDQREKARQEKNWKEADRLRDKLNELGYQVKDAKSK